MFTKKITGFGQITDRIWQRIALFTLSIIVAIGLGACSGSGSSTSEAVASDEEVSIQTFIDLPVSGLILRQDDTAVAQFSAPSEDETTRLSISLGNVQLGSELVLSREEMASLKFRDFFIQSLPETADTLRKETGTLNDVTAFDAFVNALSLLSSIDLDANNANGIQVEPPEDASALGMLTFELPMSQFLQKNSTLVAIEAYQGRFDVDPYLALSNYYLFNSTDIPSEQILKVDSTTNGTTTTANYTYDLSGNIEEASYLQLDGNGGATNIGNELYSWLSETRLSEQEVSGGFNDRSTMFAYNDAGRLTGETFNSSTTNRQTDYTYNALGLLETKEETSIQNGITTVTRKDIVYNELHLIAKTSITIAVNGNADSTLSTVFNYDDNKLASKVEVLEEVSPFRRITTQYDYQYNELGKTSAELVYPNADGVVTKVTYYTYDAFSNVSSISTDVFPVDLASASVDQETRSEFNAFGQLILSAIDSDGNGTPDLTETFVYNEFGFLIEKATKRFDTSGVETSNETTTQTFATFTKRNDIRNLISPAQVRSPEAYLPQCTSERASLPGECF